MIVPSSLPGVATAQGGVRMDSGLVTHALQYRARRNGPGVFWERSTATTPGNSRRKSCARHGRMSSATFRFPVTPHTAQRRATTRFIWRSLCLFVRTAFMRVMPPLANGEEPDRAKDRFHDRFHRSATAEARDRFGDQT